MPKVRYLPEQGGQGFIDVRLTTNYKKIALPGYLKLNYLGVRVLNGKKRDYFIPYDGKIGKSALPAKAMGVPIS